MHIQCRIDIHKAATYESEVAQFENARITGPLSQESYNRLQQLKAMLNKFSKKNHC